MPGPLAASSDGELGREELARERALVERIGASADSHGFVPFDRFMELALYAEDIGYYSGARNPLGPAGDFYTAPHVHPLFGRAIGHRIREIRDGLSPQTHFRVVEFGPGDGALAAAVLEELGRGPLPMLSYHLVERSDSLRAVALKQARTAGARAGIPVEADEGIGSSGPFVGAVIAHELLDAQPVRRLVFRNGAWRELGVRRGGISFVPGEAIPSRPLPPDPPADPIDGEIWEDAAGTAACVRSIADHLLAGVAILIDYGMERSELRAVHPTGTLAGIRRHRPVEEVATHPGGVDLSTFVDFTRVRASAARSGLRELAYSSQAEALGRWGFPELLREALDSAPTAEARLTVHLAAKRLLFGFERFRVLELEPAAAPRAT